MNISARLRQAEERVSRITPEVDRKWYRVSYGEGDDENAKRVAVDAGFRDGIDGLILVKFVPVPGQPPYSEPARLLP